MQNIFFALAALQYAIYCVYLYVRPQQARQATYKTHSEEYNLHQMQQGTVEINPVENNSIMVILQK